MSNELLVVVCVGGGGGGPLRHTHTKRKQRRDQAPLERRNAAAGIVAWEVNPKTLGHLVWPAGGEQAVLVSHELLGEERASRAAHLPQP